MAANANQGVSRADEMSPTLRWFTSALLIVFTMLVAAVCILLLSSTLTQSRLSNLAIDGVEVTIRKLDNIAQQWAQLRRLRDGYSRKLGSTEEERLALLPRLTAAEGDHSSATQEIEGLLVGFYITISGLEPDLAKLIHRQGYENQVGKIRAAKNQLQEKHPQLSETVAAIEKSYETYRETRRRQIEARAAMAGPAEQIKLLTDALQKTETKLKAVFDLIKPNLDAAGQLRVENAFFELNVSNYVSGIDPNVSLPRRMVSRFLYFLLTIQPDLLTLFLVIFMGILGSALQITHAYFMKNQAQTLGRYFQRISVGALTALVIFIVAKAGVPVIAEPGRLGGEATINPYFVSFLAIISGLLSENAISNVQAQGARLFGLGGAGIDRWVRSDLTPELAAQNLSAATLAKHLGIDETVAEAKLKGLAEIRPDEQRTMALFLRRDPRDIFTDIPPPK